MYRLIGVSLKDGEAVFDEQFFEGSVEAAATHLRAQSEHTQLVLGQVLGRDGFVHANFCGEDTRKVDI